MQFSFRYLFELIFLTFSWGCILISGLALNICSVFSSNEVLCVCVCVCGGVYFSVAGVWVVKRRACVPSTKPSSITLGFSLAGESHTSS